MNSDTSALLTHSAGERTPDDYIYDVFLSYRHDHPVGPWVSMYFYPHFRGWLREALGGQEPRIFYDERSLEPGDTWPDKLREAIRSSRVLLPVCSPGYFYSKWCLSEWHSFKERERIINVRGLRIPIKHNDGEHFPKDALEIEMSDFSECTSVMPSFVNDHRSILFEQAVKKLANAVAAAVRSAPPFRDDWPVVEENPSDPKAVPFMRL